MWEVEPAVHKGEVGELEFAKGDVTAFKHGVIVTVFLQHPDNTYCLMFPDILCVISEDY